jgi:SAM-dependent methyltransferase
MAPEVLDALLDYLAAAGLVAVKDGQARLTADAKALLENEDGVLELIHAYQPILDMAEHMLARLKATAGGSLALKKSDALTDSQAKRYAAELFPSVLAMLVKHRIGHVLDLSCGAGDLLMHLAKNTRTIVGVGIGMDGAAVRRANHAISESGLEKRLIAVTANPVDVCTETQRTFDRIGISRQLWDELDCLIAPQLFSELAARDAGANGGGAGAVTGTVIRMLASIPKKFPKAHLLVIEATASPRFDKNYYAPELSLLMRLSKTTPWPAEKWREAFTHAKLRVAQETSLATDGLTLFLCRPVGSLP